VRHLIFLLFSALCACNSHDYSLAHPTAGWTPGEQVQTIGFTSSVINVSFDVGFQRNNWGETLARCQVQVAFTRRGESDGMGESEEPYRQEINYPDEIDTCALTRFDDVDSSAPEEPVGGGQPGQPDDGDRDSEDRDSEDRDSEDNWKLRGTMDAGECIWLHGEERSWALHRLIDGQDRVYYEMADCDADTFPFGQVLDLDVGAADARPPLAGLALDDAFVVGPQLNVQVLLESPQAGLIYHRVDNPLLVEWEEVGPPPDVEHVFMHEELVMIQVSEMGVADPIEALACRPDLAADEVMVAPSILSDLPHNIALDDNLYSTSFQVDSRYVGPELQTPWGEVIRVSTTVTDGGLLVFYEEGEPPAHGD
jgi:hypothetical protein